MPLANGSDGRVRCRIAIAEDAAFCFYYADNLHLLVEAGAALVPFSLLSSERLLPNVDGLYLGGGYPELHADELEANAGMRRHIRSFCERGAAVFAKCGGLIMLIVLLLVLLLRLRVLLLALLVVLPLALTLALLC